MPDKLKQIISDPGTSEEKLIEAFVSLDSVSESPDFWIALANSDQYNLVQRRHFVFQMFHRYVKPGIQLSKLAQLMDSPKWLDSEHLKLIEDVAGAIPVRMEADDSVFVLRILPKPQLADIWAIYFRIAGKITTDQFYEVLSGRRVDEAIANLIVAEIGFSPPIVNSHSKIEE